MGKKYDHMVDETYYIYCQSSDSYSEEHVIPACLGEFKGFPEIKDRVCKECNNQIGKLEEQFCRSGPESLFREFLGIVGRPKHTKINPFERGSAGGKPINVVAPHPESGIPILWEWNPEEKSFRELRQVVLIDDHGNSHQLRIPNWMCEPQQLRQAIDELRLGKPREVLFFADDKDMSWVESLIRGLGYVEWLQPNQSATISNPVAKITITDAYFRAVAKIGFHYFLTVVPSIRGSEPPFADLRDFIISGGNVNRFVLEERTSIIKPGYRPKWYGHIIATDWQNGSVQTRAQFFFGPNYEPPVYRIRIAEGVDSLRVIDGRGHFFFYFLDGQRDHYHGEAFELTIYR